MVSLTGRRGFAVLPAVALTLAFAGSSVLAQCQSGGGQQQGRAMMGGRPGMGSGGPGISGPRTQGGGPMMRGGFGPQGPGAQLHAHPPGNGMLNRMPPNGFQQNAMMAAMQQQQNQVFQALQQQQQFQQLQQRQNLMMVGFQQPRVQLPNVVNRAPAPRLEIQAEPPAPRPRPEQKDAVPKPNDPEEEAARLLKTARELVKDADDARKNGERLVAARLQDRAVERLKDLVVGFKATRAAEAANDLLEKIEP